MELMRMQHACTQAKKVRSALKVMDLIAEILMKHAEISG
jgi:hypothetical protein